MEEPSKIGLRYQPNCFTSYQKQQDTLQAIYDYHDKTQVSEFTSIQEQKHFFSKCGEFFLKNFRLYKKNSNQPPLLVVTDKEHK
jgi:hypothetical protein